MSFFVDLHLKCHLTIIDEGRFLQNAKNSDKTDAAEGNCTSQETSLQPA